MTLCRLLIQSHRRSSSIFSPTTTYAASSTMNYAALSTTTSYRTTTARRRIIHRTLREPPVVGGNRSRYDICSLSLQKTVVSLLRSGYNDVASNMVTNSDTVPNLITSHELIKSMFLAGRYEDGIALFDFLFFNPSKKNSKNLEIYLYNLVIEAHCDAGHVDKAFQLYNYILDHSPDIIDCDTYTIVSKLLLSANRISDAENLRYQMLARNINRSSSSSVYRNLISGYLELGYLERANQLFHEFLGNCTGCCNFDGYVYTPFMEYYFNHNMEGEAMEMYQSLLDRRLVMSSDANNQLLNLLLKNGKTAEANTLFDTILKHNVARTFDNQTFNIMVNHCFELGNVSDALLVFKRGAVAVGDKNRTWFFMNAEGYNNIIGKLFDIGMVAEADELFDQMLTKSVQANDTTYTILFDAYFKQERIDHVLKWFFHLASMSQLKPSFTLVNSVFSRLINKGKIEHAGEILKRMTEKRIRKREPFLFTDTYELVLSALCKEGELDRVRNLLGLMLIHNICITPTLQGIVQEAFVKEDRIGQIESLLRQLTDLSPCFATCM